MKYHIITYGCQMNKSDSERIATILENTKFKPSPTVQGADLTILNICSIRQSAVDRAKARAQKIKQSNPEQRIILMGCIMEKNKKELKKFCDKIFEINKLEKLPLLLKTLGFKIQKINKGKVKHYLQISPAYQSSITACVPVMTGCNNFCAYCVVPHTRGREISRSKKEILCEIKTLTRQGVKEIWLLGQNVNSYQLPIVSSSAIRPKGNFAKLLKMVNDINGDFWIRFTSSHPKDLSDEMIETFAKCQKATPFFNLPIQSGDDKTLKAMNRPYTVKKYKKLVRKTRNAFQKYRQNLEKELALSTDVIVGFPSESGKQFKNSKKTFQDVAFAAAYISRYSPRPQTTALKLKDNVLPQEKKRREKELIQVVEKSALKFNKKFLNQVVDVLVLEKRKDFYLGKTRHYQSIKVKNDKNILGEFVKVKVLKVTPYGMEGKIQ